MSIGRQLLSVYKDPVTISMARTPQRGISTASMARTPQRGISTANMTQHYCVDISTANEEETYDLELVGLPHPSPVPCAVPLKKLFNFDFVT